MSRHRRSKVTRTHTDVAVVESDGWAWGVIFTITGLAALSIVTVFGVAVG